MIIIMIEIVIVLIIVIMIIVAGIIMMIAVIIIAKTIITKLIISILLILISITTMFVLLFLSVSTALWIGNNYENYSVGFLIVGLFYFLITIVLFIFRHALIKIPVINKLLNAIYNDEKD